MKKFEQTSGGAGGYAINPYGVEIGNFGDYMSTYTFPQGVQNENKLGEVQRQVPAGQYMSGPVGHASQSDTSEDVTIGTSGTEHNSSPATTEYEKKIKSYLKLRKSQLA